MELMFDAQGHYTGYKLRAISKADVELRQIDVTGAASRFPPWELLAEDKNVDTEKAKLEAAGDLDAPAESGNFDGGFVASATQAARYARTRQAKTTTP